MPRWPKAVIFDLDGTLVDSAPDIARALADGFGPLGVPPFPLAEVHGFIGGGAAVAIRRAAASVRLELTTEQEAGIHARFMQTYARVTAQGKGLYPGAHELLASLASLDVRLGLVTNKADPITRIALAALGIEGHFSAVVGARDGLPKKPDPTGLREALARLAVAPHEAVMVGDSASDVGAARGAGCRAIAVSYGYAHGAPAALGADLLVDRLADVPAALTTLMQAG
jgi:phosphoglycolate phosphatase